MYRCGCGNEKEIRVSAVDSGGTSSCGCLRRKHGLSKTKLYQTWADIKQRCYSDLNQHWKWYGARGIKMYEGWIDDPVSFIQYVESLPDCHIAGLSLDRIENDRDYEPGNLRWASKEQQANNTRFNK